MSTWNNLNTRAKMFAGVMFIPALVALFALFAALLIWRGFAFMTLWNWYVFPLFGLPQLSLLDGAALCLIVQVLTFTSANTQTLRWDHIARGVLVPVVALAMGYLFLLVL